MPDDMRWRLGTAGHPKILRLVAECGERAFRALATLWEHCAAHRRDGKLTGMDATDISIAAGWPEAPPAFVASLCKVRLLDGTPPKARVHDWAENQPWVRGLQARSDASLKAIITRWAERAGVPPAEYAANSGITTERIRRVWHTDRSTPLPSPSPLPLPSPLPSPCAPNAPHPTRRASRPTELPGPNPPDTNGSLPARLAREGEESKRKQAEYDAAFARWQAAGNQGDRAEFNRQRLASLAQDGPPPTVTTASAWREPGPRQTAKPPRRAGATIPAGGPGTGKPT